MGGFAMPGKVSKKPKLESMVGVLQSDFEELGDVTEEKINIIKSDVYGQCFMNIDFGPWPGTATTTTGSFTAQDRGFRRQFCSRGKGSRGYESYQKNIRVLYLEK